MAWFEKSSVGYLLQLVNESKLADRDFKVQKYSRVISLVKKVLSFSKDDIDLILAQTGDEGLHAACLQIQELASLVVPALEESNLGPANEFLSALLELDLSGPVMSMHTYIQMSSELKKNGFDVDRISDGQGLGIEPLIKPLVVVLTYFDFKTDQCCEGHKDREQHYPWVRFEQDAKYESLVRFVQLFNSTSKVPWTFERLVGESSFPSSIGIFRVDRNEILDAEISRLFELCKSLIADNAFDKLGCGVRDKVSVEIGLKDGVHHEQIEEAHALLASKLESESDYEVVLSIPSLSGEPDFCVLRAKGGSFEERQQSILPLSMFLVNKFTNLD